MNDLKDEVENPALLKAIKDTFVDARDTAQKLAQQFKDNVLQLRVEGSENVFNQLAQDITDLQCFLEYIGELSEGMKYFKDVESPSDPVTHLGAGLNLFKEINAAIEIKDWIMLSDLIEYELVPLLLKEDEWLGCLEEKLKIYEC